MFHIRQKFHALGQNDSHNFGLMNHFFYMDDKSDSDSSKSSQDSKPFNYILPSIVNRNEYPLLPYQPFLQPQQPNPLSSIPPLIVEDTNYEEKSINNAIPEEAKRKSHSIAEKKRRDTINQKIKDVYSMISSEKSPSKVVSLQRILDYVENLCESSKNIKRKISEAEEENEILKKQVFEFENISQNQKNRYDETHKNREGKDVGDISISNIIIPENLSINTKIGEKDKIGNTSSSESQNDEKLNNNDISSSSDESENQSKKVALFGLFIFLVYLFPSFKGIFKQYGTRTLLEYNTISYENLFTELIFGLLIQVVISTFILILTCFTLSFLVNITFFWNEIPSKYGSSKDVAYSQCKHNIDYREKAKFYKRLDEESNFMITILLSIRIFVYIMEKLWIGRIVDHICLVIIRLNILSCKCRQKSNSFNYLKDISKRMKMWESLMYYEISRIFESKQALYLANNLFCMINDECVFI